MGIGSFPGTLPGHGGLSELELDALTELVNLGVSRAANSLRELAGEEVLLTVPAVVILSREEAAIVIGRTSANPLIAVRQALSR